MVPGNQVAHHCGVSPSACIWATKGQGPCKPMASTLLPSATAVSMIQRMASELYRRSRGRVFVKVRKTGDSMRLS